MNEQQKREYPYKSLGNRLKRMREKFQESLAEVSGAVEIDVDTLSNIELGKEKPSEDILLLLISHFGIKEDEATNLWELADYGMTPAQLTDNETALARTPVVVLPNDARIVYTDVVHVTVNRHGVVMNFLQEGGPNSQPLIVSRVGMSREHAESILEVLKATLEQSRPKSLPSPDDSTSNHTDK